MTVPVFIVLGYVSTLKDCRIRADSFAMTPFSSAKVFDSRIYWMNSLRIIGFEPSSLLTVFVTESSIFSCILNNN